MHNSFPLPAEPLRNWFPFWELIVHRKKRDFYMAGVDEKTVTVTRAATEA